MSDVKYQMSTEHTSTATYNCPMSNVKCPMSWIQADMSSRFIVWVAQEVTIQIQKHTLYTVYKQYSIVQYFTLSVFHCDCTVEADMSGLEPAAATRKSRLLSD